MCVSQRNEIPYIYTMSLFIIIAAYVLVGLIFVALVLCCGFFICRIGILACLFGSDVNLNEHFSDNDSSSISKEVLKSLPVAEFKSSGVSVEDANCGICLCPYASDDLIKFLPCGHHFHSDCIDQWLSRNKTCPYCKQPADKVTAAAHEKISSLKCDTVEHVNV